MFEKHARQGRLVNLDGTPQTRRSTEHVASVLLSEKNCPAHQHARTPHPVGFRIASDRSLQRA